MSARDFFENEGLGGDWLDVLEALGPPVRIVEGLASRGGDWGRCFENVIWLDAELQEHPEAAAAVLMHELSHYVLCDEQHTPIMYGLSAGLARRAGIEGEPIAGVFPTNTPEARTIERRVAAADNVIAVVRKIALAHRFKILLERAWPYMIAGPAAAIYIFHYVF